MGKTIMSKVLTRAFSVKVAALGAACVVAAGAAGGAGVPEAHAQQRNLVAFGDSVMADPPLGQYFSSRGSSDVTRMFTSSDRVDSKNCPSSNNFAKRAGAKLGLPVEDYSCAGATSMSEGQQIWWQIDDAIARGALSPATQRVLFSSGFNDTYNNSSLSRAEARAKFVRFTAPQIERIKQAAPNARIQLVGYASITHNGNICLINGTAAIPAPGVKRNEDTAQWMMVDLARATRTEFVDMKPSTAGNSMCAPDDRRMWAGLLDFTAGSGNMPFHMNSRGHEHVANVIARS